MNSIQTERAFMQTAFPSPPPTEWYESRILPSSWPHADDIKGKRVLDYGCNSGWVGYWARKQGASVACTDIFGEACEPSLEFRMMEGDRIPFGQAEFDMILFGNVLHHGSMARHLEEFDRVLKPVGLGIFISLQEPCIPSTESEEMILKAHCAQELADGIDERRPNLPQYRRVIEAHGFTPTFYYADEPMWTPPVRKLTPILGTEHSGGIAIYGRRA